MPTVICSIYACSPFMPSRLSRHRFAGALTMARLSFRDTELILAIAYCRLLLMLWRRVLPVPNIFLGAACQGAKHALTRAPEFLRDRRHRPAIGLVDRCTAAATASNCQRYLLKLRYFTIDGCSPPCPTPSPAGRRCLAASRASPDFPGPCRLVSPAFRVSSAFIAR